MSAPLVLSLRLDVATQRRLDAERAALFPPGRTEVGAHVTLFHALPATLHDDVAQRLDELGSLPSPAVDVTGLRGLGRGVAYVLACAEVERLHADWQARWARHLTRQDAAPRRLHVTVQNKADPEVARRTLADLRACFAPWRTRATAVDLWRYDHGPWTWLQAGLFGPELSPPGC